MRSRISLIAAAICSIAGLAAAVAIAHIPGKYLDLYFHDRYFPVSKGILHALTLLVMLLPGLAAAMRRGRAPR